MPDELKLCPFCGSDKVWLDPLGIRNGKHFDFAPQCNGCGATIIPVVNWTREEAVAAWNTRAELEAAFADGAEAMRQRAAELADNHNLLLPIQLMVSSPTTNYPPPRLETFAQRFSVAIRALPLPPMEGK